MKNKFTKLVLLILINLHIPQIDMMRKKEIKNFINTIELILITKKNF